MPSADPTLPRYGTDIIATKTIASLVALCNTWEPWRPVHDKLKFIGHCEVAIVLKVFLPIRHRLSPFGHKAMSPGVNQA